MRLHRLALALFVFSPLAAQAESFLPFGKEWAGDTELPKPYGVGIDIFTMDQDYAIDSLTFSLPGATIGRPDLISVKNKLTHTDIKADAWVLPFLNVFGFVGKLYANTEVDLSQAQISGVPFALGKLPVKYDGSVYGGGLTLAYGTEKWFASLTGTWASTSLSGDFDSKVKSRTLQPKIGLIRDDWSFWFGAMKLNSEENHTGNFVFAPVNLTVPFAVDLSQADNLNYNLGAQYKLGEHLDANFELGFGSRETTLFNMNYRF